MIEKVMLLAAVSIAGTLLSGCRVFNDAKPQAVETAVAAAPPETVGTSNKYKAPQLENPDSWTMVVVPDVQGYSKLRRNYGITVKARTFSPLFAISPSTRHLAWKHDERSEFTFILD